MLDYVHVAYDVLVTAAFDFTQAVMNDRREFLISFRDDLALRLHIEIISAARESGSRHRQYQCIYMSHDNALLKVNVHSGGYASGSRICSARNLRIHTVVLGESEEVVQRYIETQASHSHLLDSRARQ